MIEARLSLFLLRGGAQKMPTDSARWNLWAKLIGV